MGDNEMQCAVEPSLRLKRSPSTAGLQTKDIGEQCRPRSDAAIKKLTKPDTPQMTYGQIHCIRLAESTEYE